MESFSRISSILGQARDLTIEAATSASSAGRTYGIKSGLSVPKPVSPREIRKNLSSRHDREILDGLRKVVAMMCRGVDCSEYFADVVKNVASPTLEIKKLVYTYLLQYAELEPDLALLSINTIQKALTDSNQVVRAMAIKVMSGIRVPVISQIVALGIKRCVSDMSPYVRKAAALAIPKCYRLDPSNSPQLTDYIATLLGDKSYYVIGAAVMAFLEVCPEKLELVHPQYRNFCKLLIDMDEWGQLAVMSLLTVYARKNFPQKAKQKDVTAKDVQDSMSAFYNGEGTSAEGAMKTGILDGSENLDPDLELFLRSSLPLLQSRNSAVIISVAKAFYHLAQPSYLPTIAAPLISLLRAATDVQYIALVNIIQIAISFPSLFAKFVPHLLVASSDPPHIWKLKLEAVVLTFPYASQYHQNVILSELGHLATGYDRDLLRESVKAIGRCAGSLPSAAPRCLRLLMKQMDSTEGTPVAESLTVVRHIIQQHPSMHKKTVIRLAKSLDTTVNPQARASIIWLVGEFSGVDGGDNIAADVLRILAKGFSDEAEVAKLQIVLLAAKVYTNYLNRTQSGMSRQQENEQDVLEMDSYADDTHPIAVLFHYVVRLARYDTSYDLRDRTRLYTSMLSNNSTLQLATLVLLAPKPMPFAPSPFAAQNEGLTLGSSALVVGKDNYVRGYEPLPEWVSEKNAPSSKLRDPIVPEAELGVEATQIIPAVVREAPTSKKEKLVPTNTVPTTKKEEKSLDQWLESEEEEEESSEEEEDDEEEEESEEEEDDDEEEEEEEKDEEESEEEEEEEDSDDADEKAHMLPQS